MAPARRICGVYLKRPDDHHRKNRKIKCQQERKEGKAFEPRLRERSGEHATTENAGGDKSEEKPRQKISNKLIRANAHVNINSGWKERQPGLFGRHRRHVIKESLIRAAPLVVWVEDISVYRGHANRFALICRFSPAWLFPRGFSDFQLLNHLLIATVLVPFGFPVIPRVYSSSTPEMFWRKRALIALYHSTFRAVGPDPVISSSPLIIQLHKTVSLLFVSKTRRKFCV
jgi:hypothetical protein